MLVVSDNRVGVRPFGKIPCLNKVNYRVRFPEVTDWSEK